VTASVTMAASTSSWQALELCRYPGVPVTPPTPEPRAAAGRGRGPAFIYFFAAEPSLFVQRKELRQRVFSGDSGDSLQWSYHRVVGPVSHCDSHGDYVSR
jgi:hypothetical protein